MNEKELSAMTAWIISAIKKWIEWSWYLSLWEIKIKYHNKECDIEFNITNTY